MANSSRPMQDKIKNIYSTITSDTKKKKLALITLSLLILAIMWNLYSRTYESTDNAFIEGRIVPISSRVPGYVDKIYVDDNQLVGEGQLLVELDPTIYQINLEKAKAQLGTAKAKYKIALENFESSVVVAPSNYESAKAAYEAALSQHELASKNLKRLKGLNELTLTRKDLDQAIADEKKARAALKEAEAKANSASAVEQTITAAEATVQELKAAVLEAEAALKSAEKDLADTKLHAPYAGKITNRQIEDGTYAQPGQSLFSIVGSDLWVVANFKESQLHKIKPGQKVNIHIDAFPNLKLSGKVDSIQAGTGSRLSLFPPENATGNYVKVVQRVPVKILFDQKPDPNIPLAVGMSVIPIVRLGW